MNKLLLDSETQSHLAFIGLLSSLIVALVFFNPVNVTFMLLGISLFSVLLFLVIRTPSILYLGFLASSLLYFDTPEGISLRDAIYFSYAGVVSLVAVFQLASKFTDLVETKLDKTFFFLYLLMGYGIFLGLLFGNAPLKVVSELTYYSPIVGYFFYKQILKKEDKRKFLLYILLAIILFVVVRNYIFYREIIVQAYLEWQTERARVAANEVILLLGTMFFASCVVLFKKKLLFILSLLLFSATFIGLIITQSRGYWLAFVLSFIAFFLINNKSQQKKIFLILLTLASTGILVAYIFFGDIFQLVLNGLAERFKTLGSGELDISLKERVLEYQTVASKILKNPIAGYGFGTTFRREELFFNIVEYRSFIHNGYLLVWYKFGIAGLASFLFLCYQILNGSYKLFKNSTDLYIKLLSLTIFSTLCGMLLVNNTSPQFLQFDSILLLTLMAAFVSHYYESKTNE